MRYSRGKLPDGPQAPQWSLFMQESAIASYFSAGEDREAITQFIFREGLGKTDSAEPEYSLRLRSLRLNWRPIIALIFNTHRLRYLLIRNQTCPTFASEVVPCPLNHHY